MESHVRPIRVMFEIRPGHPALNFNTLCWRQSTCKVYTRTKLVPCITVLSDQRLNLQSSPH